MKDARFGAVFADVLRLMRYDDHRAIPAILKKLALALFMEAGIADGDYFVN